MRQNARTSLDTLAVECVFKRYFPLLGAKQLLASSRQLDTVRQVVKEWSWVLFT
jgi:hypothetical protein